VDMSNTTGTREKNAGRGSVSQKRKLERQDLGSGSRAVKPNITRLSHIYEGRRQQETIEDSEEDTDSYTRLQMTSTKDGGRFNSKFTSTGKAILNTSPRQTNVITDSEDRTGSRPSKQYVDEDDIDELADDFTGFPKTAQLSSRSHTVKSYSIPNNIASAQSSGPIVTKSRSLSKRGDVKRTSFPPKAETASVEEGLCVAEAVCTPNHIWQDGVKEPGIDESKFCIMRPDELSTLLLSFARDDKRHKELPWLLVNLQKVQQIHWNKESPIIWIIQSASVSIGNRLLIKFHTPKEAHALVKWAKNAKDKHISHLETIPFDRYACPSLNVPNLN
jgi:hypothetical protein